MDTITELDYQKSKMRYIKAERDLKEMKIDPIDFELIAHEFSSLQDVYILQLKDELAKLQE